MSRSSWLIGIFSFLLCSCGDDQQYASKKDLTPEERRQIEQDELTKILDLDFEKDSVQLDKIWLTTGRYIDDFYAENEQGYFWFKEGKLLEHGTVMMKFLANSEYYGLDSNLYSYNEIKAGMDSIARSSNFYSIAKYEAQNEVLLTNAWLMAAVHLNKGTMDPTNLRLAWKIDSLENPKSLITELKESKDTSLLTRLKKFEPTNIEYRYLKWAMKNYLDSTNIEDTVRFTIADPKKDSASCWSEMAKALLHWKYIDSLTTPKDTLVLAVKKFQADNGLDPDAIIGNFTRKTFGKSNNDRFYHAALAFEKWRWKDKRDGKIQLHVNIAAYTFHVIRNDSLIRRHRVVTGAPDHQSPQLQAKVRYVTLFPYWNVPHSISTKEIAPYLNRDSSYLRKHGYVLLNSKEKTPADLSKVKWKSLGENYFPYRVRQNGGYGNSLGIVAFHFPNKYDVYLHDTPSKYFFKKNTRAFSHGCIRLQNPLQFAEFILKQDRPKDTLNIDTLKAWINKKFEQRITLKKPVPIELDYITVDSDSLGNIQFHPDVYEREKDFIKIMNPKSGYKPKPVPKKEEKATEVKTVGLNPRRRLFA